MDRVHDYYTVTLNIHHYHYDADECTAVKLEAAFTLQSTILLLHDYY